MSDRKRVAVLERIREPQVNALQMALRAAFARAYAPPPKMPLSEWADKFRVLSAESAAVAGRWKTSNEPMAKGVMDTLTDPLVEKVTVMAAAQVLKALDCETPIPTPSGWKKMGDMKVGDVVFDERGLPCNVLVVSDVKIGNVCYKFTFSDGAEVVCDAGHLWTVDDHGSCGRPPVRKTIEASEIAETFRARGTRNRYSVPMTKPIDLPDADLPVDPYILGVWLGDGHSYSTNITNHENDYQIIRNCEHRGARSEIVDRTDAGVLTVRLQVGRDDDTCNRGHDKRVTGRTARGNSEFCNECQRQAALASKYREPERRDPQIPELQWLGERLSALGLKKPRGEKHIPPQYLRASFEQRMELLRGLMDTDGTCGDRGRSAFTTSSDALKEGFAELLSTLGIKSKPTRVKSRDQNGNGQDSWHFSFVVYDDMPIFGLLRKLAKLPSRRGRRTTEVENRRIVNVERVESRPVRCIGVDSPSHLYLAGKDFVPTHNTEFVLNAIGYYAHGEPGPMLVVYPTVEAAEMFSNERLAPMIRDTPVLKKIFASKLRETTAKILQKAFPGGRISMVGANAPSGLASRPIRFVLCDEVDRYPASAGGAGNKGEGDPVGLAEERTNTFPNRKIVLVSTPTVKGHSRIEISYLEGDQRKYFVPCPHCGVRQVIEWGKKDGVGGVKWDRSSSGEHLPATARYVCDPDRHDPETGEVGCGQPWTEAQRQDAVAAGEWIATAPFKGHASFHASQLSSKRVPLSQVVKKFVEAYKHVEKLKKWTNLTLAETWEEGGEKADPEGLFGRRTDYSPGYTHEPGSLLPERVGLITAAVDMQDNRFEAEIVGWGPHEERWSLDYIIHMGDPTTPAFWEAMDEVLQRKFRHPLGPVLSIAATCIDSGGHHTQAVHNFCGPRTSRKVYAIKGVGGPGKKIWPDKATKNVAKKTDTYLLGVDQAKSAMQRRLMISAPGPGFCHFPKRMPYDKYYFDMLTVEKAVTKYKFGIPYKEWSCPDGARNEAWDCAIYNYAAYVSSSVDVSRRLAEWEGVAKTQASMPEKVPVSAPTAGPARRGRVRSQGVSA